jgi:hypothetical protein
LSSDDPVELSPAIAINSNYKENKRNHLAIQEKQRSTTTFNNNVQTNASKTTIQQNRKGIETVAQNNT